MTEKNDLQETPDSPNTADATVMQEEKTIPSEQEKVVSTTMSQEKRRDLDPILTRLAGPVVPKQGERIVWYNPAKDELQQEKGASNPSFDCYKVMLEHKVRRKVAHSFTFSIDSLPDDQFVYDVSYSISFKMKDNFGWLGGIKTLLQNETPCETIDLLLNKALEECSGIGSENDAEERRASFLKAMTAKAGETDQIEEIQKYLDKSLSVNGLNINTEIQMVEPKADMAPFEHLIYLGQIKNFLFTKELGIRVKGGVVTNPDLLEVARSKYHLIDEYKDSKIPGWLSDYFETKVTLEDLATDLNKVKNSAELDVSEQLGKIGKQIGFMTFAFEDIDRIPAYRIPVKATFESMLNESQAKVPFNCELVLTLDSNDRPIPWNDEVNALDWSIAALTELIHQGNYEDILDFDFNSLWKDFNGRINEYGYKIEKNRFRLKPDIEAIRLKDFGFRLEIDEKFNYTATDVNPPVTLPIKIQAQMQGTINDGANPFEKIKNLNPYDSIVDQVNVAVISTIQQTINKLTSEQLHRRFRRNGQKDSETTSAMLEAELSNVLEKEYNISIDSKKFNIDLVESPLLNIEQGLLSSENEVCFSIFKNTTNNARLKNDFKMTFIVKEIPSDGWNRFAIGNFKTYQEKLEAMSATVTNFAQAKILNSDDENILAVLTESEVGNQVIEKLFIEDSVLPEIMFEKYGLKLKIVTFRKTGVTLMPNEDDLKSEQAVQKEVVTQRALNGKHALFCQYQENLELIQNRLKHYREKEEFDNPKYSLLSAEAEKIEEKMTQLLEARVIISSPAIQD